MRKNMLKLSKFKLEKGYWSDKDSQLTLVETEALNENNKDKVLLDVTWFWHEDGMRFFVESYNLLLNYFEGDATKFHVVRNYEFSNYVWVIHV